MKRLIWIIILGALGYYGYQYYPQLEKLALERMNGSGKNATAQTPQVTPTKKDSSAIVLPDLPDAAGSRPKEPEKKAVATPPVAKASPPPESSTTEKPEPTSLEKEIAARFPLPTFQSPEVLTNNWKNVPKSAFPRDIIAHDAISLTAVGAAGSSKLEPGAKVVALGCENGLITVATSVDSTLRGQIPIEKTNLKTILQTAYTQFTEREKRKVMAQRQVALQEAQNAGSLAAALENDGPPPPPAAMSKIGPKPVVNADGTVPIMIQSIDAKQVTEIVPAEISSWNKVRYYELDGEPYWAGSVNYTAKNIWGHFKTQALALIRHGKVVKWIYSGTLEPVP